MGIHKFTKILLIILGLVLLSVTFTSYAQETVSVNVVLTVDTSGSMSGEKIEQAKEAAETFIDVLQSKDVNKDDMIGLVTFDTDVYIKSDLTRDFAQLKTIIDGLTAGGSTSLWDGVYTSVDLVAGTSYATAVVVLTDGQDNDSEHTKEEAIQYAKENKVRVFVIGIGPDVNEKDLRDLAEETGGFYWHVSAADLVKLYEVIALLCEFHPPNAEFTYYPEHPKVGETVTFDASPSYSPRGIIRYDWYFGDGTTAEGVKVQHVFTKPGNYTVILTVTDSEYFRDSEVRIINVSGVVTPILKLMNVSLYILQNPPYFVGSTLTLKVIVKSKYGVPINNAEIICYIKKPHGDLVVINDFNFEGNGIYTRDFTVDEAGRYELTLGVSVKDNSYTPTVRSYKFDVYEDTLDISIEDYSPTIIAGDYGYIKVKVTGLKSSSVVSSCAVSVSVVDNNGNEVYSTNLYETSNGIYEGYITVTIPGVYKVNIYAEKEGYISATEELSITVAEADKYRLVSGLVKRSCDDMHELYKDLGTTVYWLNWLKYKMTEDKVQLGLDALFGAMSIYSDALKLAKAGGLEAVKQSVKQTLKRSAYMINYASFEEFETWVKTKGFKALKAAKTRVKDTIKEGDLPKNMLKIPLLHVFIVSDNYDPYSLYNVVLEEYVDYESQVLENMTQEDSLIKNVQYFDKDLLDDVVQELAFANDLFTTETKLMIDYHSTLTNEYYKKESDILGKIVEILLKFAMYASAYFLSNWPCVYLVSIFDSAKTIVDDWYKLGEDGKLLCIGNSILYCKAIERIGSISNNTENLLLTIATNNTLSNPEGEILDVTLIREGKYCWVWWCDKHCYIKITVKNTGNIPSNFGVWMKYIDGEFGLNHLVLSKKLYLKPGETGFITIDWYNNNNNLDLKIKDDSVLTLYLVSLPKCYNGYELMCVEDVYSIIFDKDNAIKIEKYGTHVMRTTQIVSENIEGDFEYPISRFVYSDNGLINVTIYVRNPLPFNMIVDVTQQIPQQAYVVDTDGISNATAVKWHFSLKPFEERVIYVTLRPTSTVITIPETKSAMYVEGYGWEYFNTSSDVLTVSTPPIVNVDISPENPTVGELIEFNASGSYDIDGEIVSYEWDFGDGQSGSGMVVEHSYSHPGTYNVTLKVTDDSGVESTYTITITVSEISKKDELKQEILRLILQYLANPSPELKSKILQMIIEYMRVC